VEGPPGVHPWWPLGGSHTIWGKTTFAEMCHYLSLLRIVNDLEKLRQQFLPTSWGLGEAPGEWGSGKALGFGARGRLPSFYLRNLPD